MKKLLLLLAAALCLLAGCGKEPEPEPVTMGNPWKSFESLAEAEAYMGFSLDLSAADPYLAESFRAMKGAAEVLEVSYRDEDRSVTVRKSPGEGQNLSGVYGFAFSEECQLQNGETYAVYRETETESEHSALYIVLDHDGYSWSIYAPDGFRDDSAEYFLTGIFE